MLSVPLAALALVQVLNENPAIPPAVRVEETPKWFDQAIWATRLRQGWRMFAPDAPLTETTVVIEATTVGGRRFDPLQEVAADDDTIVLDRVIVQPGYDVYWTSFTFRAPGNSVMRNALKRWIERYPDRTGRADDAIASYVGYVVTQRSPGPHGKLPHAIRVRPFMRGP